MTLQIRLRDVIDSDFPIFLEHLRDPTSAHMAAFGTKDNDAGELAARWKKSRLDASTVQKAILEGGTVIGFVATFLLDDKPQVTYWIARTHWGRGIATAALSQLLRWVTMRPIYASAAKDNLASLRVLQKCGFVIRGSASAFATARSAETEEVFLELR
jgi:RimJ/RimL family protein N-acetyltransferase